MNPLDRRGPRGRPSEGPRGRGSAGNPKNRFHALDVLYDEPTDIDERARKTEFVDDHSRSILSRNNSPDLYFDLSVNPYRGCEHGCSYCYARPTHEYLGLSAGLDFESRILVKKDAPELLRRELSQQRYTPQVVALSGVTDPYQPVERRLGITRGCLEVLAEARNPVVIVTKNHLVTRDLDLLQQLSEHNACAVFLSITTLDVELARALEPRASHPERRLDAIARLTAAGVPAGVLVAPVIPALNDHEMPAILESAAAAGACQAQYIVLRLPYGLKALFEEWLLQHRPRRAEHVLSRIRQLRDGQLNDSQFGRRGRGVGPLAAQLHALFEVTRKKHGLDQRRIELSTQSFRRPTDRQLTLFEDEMR